MENESSEFTTNSTESPLSTVKFWGTNILFQISTLWTIAWDLYLSPGALPNQLILFDFKLAPIAQTEGVEARFELCIGLSLEIIFGGVIADTV